MSGITQKLNWIFPTYPDGNNYLIYLRKKDCLILQPPLPAWFRTNSYTSLIQPQCLVHMTTLIQMEFFVLTAEKGIIMWSSVLWHNLHDRTWRQQTLLYCDTIYRTEVGGSRPFCIVTQSSEHNMEAADPSVLRYTLQDRARGSRFFRNAG
jgi:hypothetical protein